jgi:hypothetical protein
MSVEIHNWIEVIKEEAFWACTSHGKILTPPAIRAIKNQAFFDCLRLTTANLNNGLVEIGVAVFFLIHISCTHHNPPTARKTKNGAFYGCSGLTTVILNNGVLEIKAYAFKQCTSLVRIASPLAIRAIKDWSFDGCLGSTTVILNKGKGLEEIGMMAFARYMPLVCILIPPSVTAIHEKAFMLKSLGIPTPRNLHYQVLANSRLSVTPRIPGYQLLGRP